VDRAVWWGIERKVGRLLGSPKSDPLVVDGLCGSITTKWVLWFQQAQALYRDGIVDPVFPPVDDPTIGGDRRGSLSGAPR